MKALLTKQDVKRLKAFSHVIENRPTMPMLGYIRITLKGSKLIFTGTDLETAMRIEVEGSGSEYCSICVPWKLLKELVKAGGIEVEIPSKDKAIINGRVINGVSEDEYPSTSVDKELAGLEPVSEIQTKDLPYFQTVINSVSKDETRFNLTGLTFESVKGRARIVGCDGHRLAFQEIPGLNPSEDYSILIPAKPMAKLFPLMDGLSLSLYKDGYLRTSTKGLRIAIRAIDGTFPDYSQVIPKTPSGFSLEVKNELLLAELRSAMQFVEDKAKILALTLNGSIKVQGSSPKLGSYENFVPVTESMFTEGTALTLGVNGRYLSEMIGGYEKSKIETNGELGAIVVKDANNLSLFTGIIMPARLG